MKQLVLVIGILLFGVLETGVTCETGVVEKVQYDGGREWLLETSFHSANGTTTRYFWGSDPIPTSAWNEVLKSRATVGGRYTMAKVSLSVDEGAYELQFFDGDGNLAESLTVQGGSEKTLEIDLPIEALRYGYRANASDAKRVRYEIRLLFPSMIAKEQFSLGTELAQQGHLEEAIVKFSEAIRLDPQLVAAYANRGLAYRLLGQHERAIKDYDEVIRLDPQSASAYANRGGAYVGLDQNDRAIEDLNEAIRLNPQNAMAHTNRATAYLGLDQNDRAIEDLDKAISLDPQLALAYSNRGAVYGMLGQFSKAIEDLSKAIRLDPQNAGAYDNRSRSYNELGQPQQAKADRDKACQLDNRSC